MKFSMKLLLWTMIVMALILGFSGFSFVNYVFETSLSREEAQALDENSILRFAFETAALNVPAKYNVLQDYTIEQIASDLENSGPEGRRLLRISDEKKKPLYTGEGFFADGGLLGQTDGATKTYRVLKGEDRYYIHTAGTVNAIDRILYLETMRDISEVFHEREMGFSVYRRMTMVMLAIGMAIMHFISAFLTKPVRLLTKATRQMAAGDYGYRAELVSRDELGELTLDFNRMAEALQENIKKLEDEVRSREEFVGAFAHELKTPLTSIIGYADLLRSRKLEEEKAFLAANYIYTEGKRLEAMSIRLLDILVAKKEKPERRRFPAEEIFSYLKEMFGTGEGISFVFSYENGQVWGEANLLKTVMINLVDNACKASEEGGTVEITGKREESGYRFTVKDDGIGIPREEQAKVTKAFYMVDKSRSRSKNGAGLGLALCVRLLLLHRSRLEIESVPGEGTRMSFYIPDDLGEKGEGKAQEQE